MLQARQPLDQADGLDGAIINANRALSQAGPLFWVTFYGVALILAIVLGTSLMISNIRDHEIGRTEKELESMVRLLSKQFDSHLENFEAVPKSVAKYLSSTSSSPQQFNELAGSESFHRFLREKPQIPATSLVSTCSIQMVTFSTRPSAGRCLLNNVRPKVLSEVQN